MKSFFLFLCKISNAVTQSLDWSASLFALAIRLYLAKIFLWSGLLKATDWPATLALFKYEYQIIWLDPEIAAYLGTAAELILPVLLLLGLGARIPALLFFLFNIATVLNYPILLTPQYACAIKDHVLWGVLIAIIMFYGHGRWSIDYLLQKKICKEYKY